MPSWAGSAQLGRVGDDPHLAVGSETPAYTGCLNRFRGVVDAALVLAIEPHRRHVAERQHLGHDDCGEVPGRVDPVMGVPDAMGLGRPRQRAIGSSTWTSAADGLSGQQGPPKCGQKGTLLRRLPVITYGKRNLMMQLSGDVGPKVLQTV